MSMTTSGWDTLFDMPKESGTVGQIYELISKISGEAGALAPEKNGGVPFAFRGVDAVVSHISPLLKKYGVIVVPEVLDAVHTARDVGTKRVTQTELTTQFTFYAPDGSKVSARTVGLAQDFADRSAAQAQSVAFRVALLQVFALPTTDKEPEVNGEEVQRGIAQEQAKGNAAPAAAAKVSPPSEQVTKLQADIKALIGGEYVDGQGVVRAAIPAIEIDKVGDRISGKPGAQWKRNAGILQKVIAEVTK